MGFPGGSDGEDSACDAGDRVSIPGLEDPLEKGMATQSHRKLASVPFFLMKPFSQWSSPSAS